MGTALDLRTLAAHLGGEVAGGEVLCPGPGHSKADRSLAVRPKPDAPGGFVVHSHANDDPIACKDYVRERLGEPTWQPGQDGAARGAKAAGTKPRVVTEYLYRDAEGAPFLRVRRTAEKQFYQARWTGQGWENGKPRAPKIPYRLPQLIAAPADAPVYVVEGEKDADRLARWDLIVTTNSEGAGKWASSLDRYFEGRTVYIMADNDQAGRDHARDVAQHLAEVAADVRIVSLPGLPEKGDASDWIEAGGDLVTLEQLCRDAASFDPGDVQDDGDAGPAPKAKKRPKKAPRSINDTRPVIRVVAGDIRRIVDEAERALISRGGLYQRANRIVSIGAVPVITHDRNEVIAQRILERGEHALAEDLAETACVEKYDARAEDFVTVNPPAWVIKTLLDRAGRFRFPVLTGIINAPTLRSDGTLLSEPGYDRGTGLFLDPCGTTFPTLTDRPDKTEAREALAFLGELIAGFPFVDDADRSVALSAILTACIRRSLRTSPLHAFTAPTPGSGKSLLVDIASVITSGREAGVIAQGKTEEEMEKRLGSLFLQGAAVVAIDNCEAPVGGEFLCQVLTQTSVGIRPLGRSEVVEVATDSFVTATGNNLVVAGDMTRRALLCDLNAQLERPELRTFEWEPVARVKADRGAYVGAALTILRAYHAAGRPRQATPLGSFEDWSNTVRSALMWLGCADPVKTMDKARALDPHLDALGAVIANWSQVLGDRRVTTRQIIERATEQATNAFGGKGDFVHPDFREALLTVAGVNGTINSRRLGIWLVQNKDRIVGGQWIDRSGVFEGSMTWCLAARGVVTPLRATHF